MAPTTRGASTYAFYHLLENVLEHDFNSPLLKALARQGYTKISQLLSLHYESFSEFTYQEKGEDDAPDIEVYVPAAQTL